MPEIDLGPIIGPQGPQGATGPAGAVGPGVPAGGTAGQIVTKKSSTGFDTEWRSPVNDANQTEAGYVLDARMGKTLGDKIEKLNNYGTAQNYATQEELNTYLSSVINEMNNKEKRLVSFRTSAEFGLFKNGDTHFAEISKYTESFTNVIARPVASNNAIFGYFNTNTWYWDRMSIINRTKFEIGNHSVVTVEDVSNYLDYCYSKGFTGLSFVEFYRNDQQIITGTMMYNFTSRNYGDGILASYYNDTSRVLTVNGTTTIENLQTKNDWIIESITHSNSATFSSNSINHIDINVAKSGYTPQGILAISGNGTNGLALMEFYIEGSNKAIIYYRNVTANAITPTSIRVKILYIKN